MNEDEKNIELSDSIKLIKNTKGYNWEIKVYQKESEQKDLVEEVDRLDKELRKRFSDEK